MELKDLLKSLAELDEMEAEDGMNLAESELNEASRKVLIKVSYDGKELDSFYIDKYLPDEFDKDKITTEIEVL